MNDTLDLKRPRPNVLSKDKLKLIGLIIVFLITLVIFILQAYELLEIRKKEIASAADFMAVSQNTDKPSALEQNLPKENAKLFNVNVYVAKKSQPVGLFKVSRQIPKPENKKQLISLLLEQLQITPENNELRPTLHRETELLSILIKDKVLYLNLNMELVTKGSLSPLESFITLQSITNTLTALPEIEKVKFLVANRERLTLQGHFDLKCFWSFDSTIVYDL